MLIMLTTPVSNICSILSPMKFGERIERALQEMQWGPKDLEQRTGVADSTISALTRRGSDRTNYKEAIIKGFPPERINHEWLRSETGVMTQPTRPSAVSDGSVIPISLDENPNYPAIRKVKFKLSAGASGFGVEYDGEDHQPIVFGAYWYEVNKLRPEALFAVRVANGSMEPGLHNGDIVVVNTLSTQPKDGTVFAINYEGEMVIKRLIRDDGEWWLHSDNPDQVRYKRKRMHGDCFLIGEVIQKQSMHI